jgi:hypothetical protein
VILGVTPERAGLAIEPMNGSASVAAASRRKSRATCDGAVVGQTTSLGESGGRRLRGHGPH